MADTMEHRVTVNDVKTVQRVIENLKSVLEIMLGRSDGCSVQPCIQSAYPSSWTQATSFCFNFRAIVSTVAEVHFMQIKIANSAGYLG